MVVDGAINSVRLIVSVSVEIEGVYSVVVVMDSGFDEEIVGVMESDVVDAVGSIVLIVVVWVGIGVVVVNVGEATEIANCALMHYVDTRRYYRGPPYLDTIKSVLTTQ